MKNVLILGVVAFLLASFAYVWLFVPSEREVNQVNQETGVEPRVTDESSEAVVPESGRGTLAELRRLGTDIECTISHDSADPADSIEGTYFVSGGDIRGDFLTSSPDLSGQMLSSMIIVDTTMYVWSEIEGETYGMQMDLSQVDEEESTRNQPVAFNESIDYQCRAWPNVDRTIFTPPADVLFQDVSAMFEAGMEYGTIYEE